MDCLTFGHLLLQYLQEDVLENVLNMDEVGVVSVDELVKTLKLLEQRINQSIDLSNEEKK